MDCTICAFETSRRAGASSRVAARSAFAASATRAVCFCGFPWSFRGARCVFASRKPLAGGASPGPPNDIPRATQRKAARHGPSPEVRGRTQDPHGRRARGASLHALEILTSDRPGSVAYRTRTSTSGCMCMESPRPCARAGAPYVAARVAVVPRPHERRCRSRVCGRGGSGTATVGMCTAIPTSPGVAPDPSVLGRKALKGRMGRGASKPPMWPASAARNRSATTILQGSVGDRFQCGPTGRACACSEARFREGTCCRPAPRWRAPRHRGTPRVRDPAPPDPHSPRRARPDSGPDRPRGLRPR